MNPQTLHSTRSRQKGRRFQIRAARKGDTNARFIRRIGPSHITQLETSTITLQFLDQLYSHCQRIPSYGTCQGAPFGRDGLVRELESKASRRGCFFGGSLLRQPTYQKVELSCSIRPQPHGLRDALRVLDRYLPGLNETMFDNVADTIGTFFADSKHVPPYPSSRASC